MRDQIQSEERIPFFLEYKLMRAEDMIKDQSFFLCHLTKSVLPLIEFPIGHLMKSDVKRLASENGFGENCEEN